MQQRATIKSTKGHENSARQCSSDYACQTQSGHAIILEICCNHDKMITMKRVEGAYLLENIMMCMIRNSERDKMKFLFVLSVSA